jgi:hypothetical protein
MKRLLVIGLGFGLGFVIGGALIAAGLLAAIGVGGHVLSIRDRGIATVLGFDPSQVAARAPIPGGIAILGITLFVVVFRCLGHSPRPKPNEKTSGS